MTKEKSLNEILKIFQEFSRLKFYSSHIARTTDRQQPGQTFQIY